MEPEKQAAPPVGPSRTPVSPGAWWVVWLMFLATVVNYMDRQTLGSVSAFIIDEFKLTEEQYGWIEAWFGLSFAVTLIFAGFLADRGKLRWLYAGAFLLWSAAGFVTGTIGTFFGLVLCRAVLGIGEAFNWPCAVGVVRRILPREAQGLGNGIFSSGMAIGAIITPLLVLMMVKPDGEGWRTLFMVVGAGGSLWIILWLRGTRGAMAAQIDAPAAGEGTTVTVPFLRVFLMREFWITFAVGMAVNIAWHFYRVWLPRYLKLDLGFDPKSSMQYILIAFYVAADLGSMLAGWGIRRMARSGLSVERSRQRVLMASALICLVATPVAFKPHPYVMIPLICLVGAGLMAVFAVFYSLVQDISPGHTSKCLGLIGATTWFTNAGLHPMVGRFADHFHPAMGKFAPMILAAGALPLISALVALTWPEKPVPALKPALDSQTR